MHEGSGELETVFGAPAVRAARLRRDPARHDLPRAAATTGPHTWLTFHTPGEIETPNRYRNRYGQLLEHAPFSQRDFHPPAELETHRERGDFELIVRVRGGYQRFVLDYHPLDVVGWDGYVYPYTFNIHDFEPKSGRLHQPPPAHQTFQGPNFVICSFCPRNLDWDPLAVPLPYHHSNLQSEEVIYYVDGQFGSRKGVDVGRDHAAPERAAARPAAGPRREVARRDAHRGARGHVRHVPPAAAHAARARPRRPELRAVVAHAGWRRRVSLSAPGSRSARGGGARRAARRRRGRAAGGGRRRAAARRSPRRPLNPLIELGPDAWRAALERRRRACRCPRASRRCCRSACATTSTSTRREEHATNFGRIFRPGQPRAARQLAARCRSATTAARRRSSSAARRCARPAGMLGAGRVRRRRARSTSSASSASSARRRGEHLRRRARQRLERARHPALRVRAARAVPRQVVRDVDLGVGRRRCDALERRARRAARAGPAAGAAPARRRAASALDIALEVELNGEVISRPNARGSTGRPSRCSPT